MNNEQLSNYDAHVKMQGKLIKAVPAAQHTLCGGIPRRIIPGAEAEPAELRIKEIRRAISKSQMTNSKQEHRCARENAKTIPAARRGLHGGIPPWVILEAEAEPAELRRKEIR